MRTGHAAFSGTVLLCGGVFLLGMAGCGGGSVEPNQPPTVTDTAPVFNLDNLLADFEPAPPPTTTAVDTVATAPQPLAADDFILEALLADTPTEVAPVTVANAEPTPVMSAQAGAAAATIPATQSEGGAVGNMPVGAANQPEPVPAMATTKAGSTTKPPLRRWSAVTPPSNSATETPASNPIPPSTSTKLQKPADAEIATATASAPSVIQPTTPAKSLTPVPAVAPKAASAAQPGARPVLPAGAQPRLVYRVVKDQHQPNAAAHAGEVTTEMRERGRVWQPPERVYLCPTDAIIRLTAGRCPICRERLAAVPIANPDPQICPVTGEPIRQPHFGMVLRQAFVFGSPEAAPTMAGDPQKYLKAAQARAATGTR